MAFMLTFIKCEKCGCQHKNGSAKFCPRCGTRASHRQSTLCAIFKNKTLNWSVLAVLLTTLFVGGLVSLVTVTDEQLQQQEAERRATPPEWLALQDQLRGLENDSERMVIIKNYLDKTNPPKTLRPKDLNHLVNFMRYPSDRIVLNETLLPYLRIEPTTEPQGGTTNAGH